MPGTGEIEAETPAASEERTQWLEGRSIRQQTARGLVINSAFQVGLAGLGLAKRLAVAAFLTREEFGFWGLLVATLVTLSWLKQVGVSQKYVQQGEPDQERAFQRAFTLELCVSMALFVLILAALPLYALAYDRSGFYVAGAVLALSLPLGAFHTPIWIAYRQMRFLRQRVLSAVDPVVSAVVMVALAATGFGYWSLIVGAVAGSAAAAVAAVATSPYKLALTMDRETFRSYFSFSWPLFLGSASSLLTIQGAVLVGNYTVGLVGLSAIALANAFAQFVDRADAVVRETLYPAAAAVRDRAALLFEAFSKSNQMALMWSLPFGFGLALFAGDLVTWVVGEKYRDAEFLFVAFGLILGVRQVGFNWIVFMAAVNRTRPMAVSGMIQMLAFAVITAPMMFAWDLEGYVAGMSIAVAIDILVRFRYLRSIFQGFNVAGHVFRSFLPAVPPVFLILAIRAIEWGDRTATIAVAELLIFMIANAATIFVFQRPLIRELLAYLRGTPRDPAPAGDQQG